MSNWFDIDAISEKIKNSVDQASKLVEDMNLDNMQEFQEREETDPEFAAHNAAVRQHQELMAEIQRQEKQEHEKDKKEEYFTPFAAWDEPVGLAAAAEEEEYEEELEYEDGPESELGEGEYYEEEEGTATTDIHMNATHQLPVEESLLSRLADTVAHTELPDMPKISFSFKSQAATHGQDGGEQSQNHSDAETNKPAANEEFDPIKSVGDFKSNIPVTSSARTVIPNPSRLWSSIGLLDVTASHGPVSLEAKDSRKMYFDRVDEEIDLEADPILKQVELNRTNPGRVRENTMKDVMAKIMLPFQNMASQKAITSATPNRDYNKSSAAHYGDLPHSSGAQQSQHSFLSVTWSVLTSFLMFCKLLGGALLGIVSFAMPLFKNILSHLANVFSRLIAAGSSRRNGEVVSTRDRVSNVGWCMWTHMSSNKGLGTLTGLLVIYSYWKFGHEFWG